MNNLQNKQKSDATPMGYDTLLGAVASLYKMPPSNYKIDVWIEGKTFNYIDTETGIVCYSEMVKLSCGCCFDYEQKEVAFKSLYRSEQFEILSDLYDRYCT